MKKSQLREIILEEIKKVGYVIGPDGQPKETDGGSTKTFRDILTTMAKQGMEKKPYTGDAKEGDRKIAKYGNVKKGNDILATANQLNIDRILGGELPKYDDNGEEVSEGTLTLTGEQVKSQIKELDPKDLVKISYVGGNGNRATETNFAENWISKFGDISDTTKFSEEPKKVEKEKEFNRDEKQAAKKIAKEYSTEGKLFISDKRTQPKDSTVRRLGSLD